MPICRLPWHLDNFEPCDVDLLWKKMAKWSFVRWQQHYCHLQRWHLKALIKICMKLFFIQAQILQAVLFDSRISIHNLFLPQSVTPKQCNAINVSMLKSISIKFGHCHIAMLSMMLRFFRMVFIQICIRILQNNTIERNIQIPSILIVRK